MFSWFFIGSDEPKISVNLTYKPVKNPCSVSAIRGVDKIFSALLALVFTIDLFMSFIAASNLEIKLPESLSISSIRFLKDPLPPFSIISCVNKPSILSLM